MSEFHIPTSTTDGTTADELSPAAAEAQEIESLVVTSAYEDHGPADQALPTADDEAVTAEGVEVES